MSFFKKIFGEPPPPPEPFEDPVMGRLLPADDYDGWLVEQGPRRMGFELILLGPGRPSAEVLTYAYDVFNNRERFETQVAEFLAEQGPAFEADVPDCGYGSEISKLRIERVWFAGDGPPGGGMIWFHNPSARVWRCDMRNGQPCDLGFDS